MKSAPFGYEQPSSLAEAATLLQSQDLVTKVLAGGQSLGPMLNLRLVHPQLLVDITAIPELKRAEASDDAIVLGACVTHANIEDGRVPDGTNGVLPRMARAVAYRAVRNRGTIGGSLAHADPAADWVSILTALGAEAIVFGPAGQRSLPVERLMVGAFEVALDPGEILEAVRIPRLSKRARWGYYKFCRRTGEFADAIGAVLHDPERGICRAVIGATDSTPILVADAASLFGGAANGELRGPDPDSVLRILDEAGMTDPYERQIHLVALRRAAARAAA